MKCQKVKNLLPLYCGGELPWLKNIVVGRHIHSCEECGAELQRLKRMSEVVIQSLRDKEVTDFDESFWEWVLFRLPKERAAQESFLIKDKKQIWSFRKIVPALIGAAAILVALFIGYSRRLLWHDLGSENDATLNYPVVENVNKPGVTVMTFKTDDPKITIIWFFEEEPNS